MRRVEVAGPDVFFGRGCVLALDARQVAVRGAALLPIASHPKVESKDLAGLQLVEVVRRVRFTEGEAFGVVSGQAEQLESLATLDPSATPSAAVAKPKQTPRRKAARQT